MVADPSDRDADFYKLTKANPDHWWDMSDTAAINTASFNHYAEWLRLWNVKSGKRIVLWQIPEGNSNHLNVNNGGGARQGYKDNRAEYFLGNGTAHIAKFAECRRHRVPLRRGSRRAELAPERHLHRQQALHPVARSHHPGSGRLAIGAGAAWVPPVIPATPRPVPPPILDGYDHLYEFETDTQKWTTAADIADAGAVNAVAKVEWTTAKAFRGKGSLAVTFTGVAGTGKVYVPAAAVPSKLRSTFTFGFRRPTRVISVQSYASINAAYVSKWTASKRSPPALGRRCRS